MNKSPGQPRLRDRCLVSTVSGLIACSLILVRGRVDARGLAFDFTWPWRAARIMMLGHNPYAVIQATGVYPFSDRLRYPLPAAVAAMPFAPLNPWHAGAVFAGVGIVLFTFVITREGWFRLPLLFSGPIFLAVWLCQWSPLLSAAALLPVLGGLLIAKPTLGLALFAYRPRLSVVLGAIVLSAIAFYFVPDWPVDFLQVAHGSGGSAYVPPIAQLWLGPVLLLAALRWDSPEGRLLLIMAFVPQSMALYDQVPLLLLPRSFRQVCVFTLCSQLAFIGAWLSFQTQHGAVGFSVVSAPWVMAGCYLPALILVLCRPSRQPAWFARRLSRLLTRFACSR